MAPSAVVDCPANEGAPDGPVARWRWTVLGWIAVVVASHLPFFVQHFVNLWRYRPHYEFAPFLVVAFVWLMWKRWPSQTVYGTASRLSAWLLLLLGLLCLAASVVLFSPWLGAALMKIDSA